MWKQLYSLNSPGGTLGRSAGQAFSERNRKLAAAQRRVDARAQAAVAAAAAERAGAALAKHRTGSSTTKQKQQLLRVPHFRRSGSQAQQPCDPLAAVPRRRSRKACIAAALQAGDRLLLPPAPSGRVIDEREKERFARVMQFGGAVPCPARELSPAGQARIAAKARRSSAPTGNAGVGAPALPSDSALQRAVLLQQRFAELDIEVQERSAFVGSMGKALSPSQLQATHTEVTAKVSEMRSTDAQLRQLVV